MATPQPEPDYIIIWLDQYIGLAGLNMQLKCSIGQQTNPDSEFPVEPERSVIDRLIQVRSDVQESFEDIPNNLKVFSEPDECLKCIDESFKQKKKIFLITSGTLGEKIAPEIIHKYSSLETIYVFCGYYKAHVEWALDCLENNIGCIMINFPIDLLDRLLRDVAEYFITQGDVELDKDQKLAYSAIDYFNWAKLLIERANNFATAKIYVRLVYVLERIEFAKKQIEQSNNYGNTHSTTDD